MKPFENLPSQNTPVVAVSLNQIQDNLVVVSATEPTGDNREKVWIQKGKNRFNKDNVVGNLSINADGVFEQDETASIHYIQVVSGKTYSISSNLDRQWVLNTSTNKPSLNGSGNARTILIGTTIQVTIPEGHNYLNIRNHPTSANEDSINQNVQVEQGTTVTEYEEYIEPKIYVLNNNDVYEEFISKEDILEVYSTAEKIVGKWTNEGYLYRKVINGTLSSTDETIINLEEKIIPRNFYGDIYNASLKSFIPLNYANVSAPVYTYISNAGANTTINIVASDIFRGCDYMIVIEYLKY